MSNNVLPEQGWVRVKTIIGDKKANPPVPPLIPIAQSTLWDWCAKGKFPPPQYPFGPGLPLWEAQNIRALLKPVAESEAAGAAR
jgi:prophage regulatory protein